MIKSSKFYFERFLSVFLICKFKLKINYTYLSYTMCKSWTAKTDNSNI